LWRDKAGLWTAAAATCTEKRWCDFCVRQRDATVVPVLALARTNRTHEKQSPVFWLEWKQCFCAARTVWQETRLENLYSVKTWERVGPVCLWTRVKTVSKWWGQSECCPFTVPVNVLMCPWPWTWPSWRRWIFLVMFCARALNGVCALYRVLKMQVGLWKMIIKCSCAR